MKYEHISPFMCAVYCATLIMLATISVGENMASHSRCPEQQQECDYYREKESDPKPLQEGIFSCWDELICEGCPKTKAPTHNQIDSNNPKREEIQQDAKYQQYRPKIRIKEHYSPVISDRGGT